MKRSEISFVAALAVALAGVGCRGQSAIVGSTHQPSVSGSLDGSPGSPAPVGATCTTVDEAESYFPGYDGSEVVVEESAACTSGLCVVNHMQGRTGCPYGQTAEQASADPACFVPGTDRPVKVAVIPQWIDRQADRVSTCSCRCAGPGPGPFCACPGGMECLPLIDSSNTSLAMQYAGSYCVPMGTSYDASVAHAVCRDAPTDCGSARSD